MIVAMYLVAIVLANMSVALFGPQFAVINCFLFIGLDLTSRDLLHEKWHRRGLAWKMALLVGTGSALSWVLNRNAGPVAIASFVAFMSAGVIDTLVYQVLREKAYLLKINGSNVATSIVDSFVFVVIAFGSPVLWGIIGLAIVSKFAGGFFWSLVLRRVVRRENLAA